MSFGSGLTTLSPIPVREARAASRPTRSSRTRRRCGVDRCRRFLFTNSGSGRTLEPPLVRSAAMVMARRSS